MEFSERSDVPGADGGAIGRRVEIVTVSALAQLMKSELAITTAVWRAVNGKDVLFYEP